MAAAFDFIVRKYSLISLNYFIAPLSMTKIHHPSALGNTGVKITIDDAYLPVAVL
jgi:hypothetical protein